MAPSINLLPWRDWQLKRRNQLFLAQLTGVLLAALALVGMLALHLGSAAEAQQRRNALLQQAVAELDQRITEIAALQQQRDGLLAHIDAIQTLAADSAVAVHIFDELANRVPSQVHFQAVELKESRLTLSGIATSHTEVSTLMRNLDASAWFTSAALISIEKAKDGGALRPGASAFTVTAALARKPSQPAATNAERSL